ncbi:hypothetical protein HanHA300_Chr06g0199851 [Helianthus annuus]|nr:hypothetical protein HanHA300_Chr06g0199851 [Helianthus annuus]KAJ0572340.1 hypothetical protein HanHA89_Chr06g0214661 [Helianthus annuus]KAJ0736791.1 hypothetical protein HanLR1_Chr06g0199801 [Helianthus annuus]KAJ0739728.1 hypothetical protein HanOQP8_Chr06g0208941 [Helianthus annuus]
MSSDSALGGVCGWLPSVKVSLGKKKLSPEKEKLCRRNAAEARRFPVCRSAIASSINPRWQHA